MEERKPGIAGIPDPKTGFVLVALGTAKHPDPSMITDKRYADGVAVVVRCGCDQATEYHRLAEKRLVICPHCDAVIARVGRKIVAANWPAPKPLPS